MYYLQWEDRQYKHRLEHNIDTNICDANGKTAFHLACSLRSSMIHDIKLLLENDKTDVNIPDENNNTPFSVACASNTCDVIKLLLSNDRINVNKPNNEGRTPLHCCCAFRNVHNRDVAFVLKMLLEDDRIKDDMNKKDNDGKTPFELLCGIRYDAIKFLIDGKFI